MTISRLVLRTLRHFAAANSLAILCLALSTAVICGSLIVGRSVRQSLREESLSRLGSVTHAVTGTTLFPDDLAQRVLGARQRSTALILSRGTVSTDIGSVVPQVSIVGIDPSFGALYPGCRVPVVSDRNVAINTALAGLLGASEGDDIVVTLARSQSAPLDTLFANRSREGSVVTLRLHISQILRGRGPASFALDSATSPPCINLFIARDTLADALGKAGKANTLLFEAAGSLALSINPADCGMRLTSDAEHHCLYLSSDRLLLRDAQIDEARKAAEETKGSAARVSVFLADSLHNRSNNRAMSYAILAALEGFEPPSGDISLNSWASADVAAHPGDNVLVYCLTPHADGAYSTTALSFTVGSINAPIDRNLTPQFQGITDADRISDWKPPFPVDLSRVTGRDDAYWAKYRAAPKAFVRLIDAQRYWSLGPAGSLSGWVTSVRITPPQGETLPAYQRRFEAALSRRLDPRASGLSVRPLRSQALKASQGGTDFSDLFLSLGFFVILSAAGSASMLMRLAIERRSKQIGLLKALGFSNPKLCRVVVSEGILLALAGAVIGGPLGELYGQFILWVLSGPWSHVASGVSLVLHSGVSEVAVGMLSGFLVGAIATVGGVWKVLRLPSLSLMTGLSNVAPLPRQRSEARQIFVGIVLVVGLLVATRLAREEAFMLVGFVLLIAGLYGIDCLLAATMSKKGQPLSFARMAVRNAAFNRGHSLIIFGLVAASSFLLVAVTANTRRFTSRDAIDIRSGAGGFALVATSSLPIPGDFSTPAGRARLGFSPQDQAIMNGTAVYGLLMSSGEDASCLNLAHPMAPKILGVSPALIKRGGFSAHWRDLDKVGAIPAFADADTADWILGANIGQTYKYRNGPVAANLRIAGLLQDSIFAGQLLVSEDHFHSLFPDERTSRFFLVQTPPGRADKVAEVLRRNLGSLGLDVRGSSDLLNTVAAVQNTYISAFDALGGLGMLLGTAMLAAMLLRSAAERRKELALITAVGFRSKDIVNLLLYETVGLLLLGVIWGALCGLISSAPYLVQSSAAPNWRTLASLLSAIMLTGIAACFAAGRAIARGPLLAALRSE